MISRVLVTAIFVGATVSTGVTAYDHAAAASAHFDARAFSLAGYWVLRTAVTGAFTVFIAVRDAPRSPSRDPIAFLACAAALGGLVAMRQQEQSETAAILVGDLIALLSCAWLLVAALALGRSFGVLPEARALVIRGPYRLVRHPLYLGEIGAVFGFLIGALSVWNIGMTAVFLAGQAVRMGLEERALTREFPEYAAYAARTPRLVPSMPRYSARPEIGTRPS